MTHCLRLVVKLNSYDDVKELKDALLRPDGESGLVFYCLRQTKFNIEPKNGLCPFIYFPDEEREKEEDGSYLVLFDTGSHCAWDDTVEALYCWTHGYIVLKELGASGIDYKYWISADYADEHLSLKQAFKKIMHENHLFNKKTA